MSWLKRLIGSEKPAPPATAGLAPSRAPVSPAAPPPPGPAAPAGPPRPAAATALPGPARPPAAAGPKPSSENGDYLSEVRDLGDQYELSGPWMDQIFSGATVRLPKDLDVQALFALYELPPLLPDNAKYVQGLSFRGEDADHTLRQEWAEVLLHHPNLKVVWATLSCRIPTDTIGLQHTLAYLLTFGNAEIEAAAVRCVWANADPSSDTFAYRTMLTVLAGRGMIPSGIDKGRAKAAVQRLRAACPATLSPEQREDFLSAVRDLFGEG